MKKRKYKLSRILASLLLISSLILLLTLLAGCESSSENLNENDGNNTGEAEAAEIPAYLPLPRDDWETSTPQEQGLDPDLIEDLYDEAEDLDTLYALLVIKNGYLISEEYFNGGSANQKTLLQSVSKSFITALIELAIHQGCISGIDQKMVEFFPDVTGEIADTRKNQITIEQMMQMRAGYPDEETDGAYMDALYWGEYPHLIVDFPLVNDPGTDFNYSNLTYNWLAIILNRACGTDLKSFAQEHLFQPMDIQVGDWLQDRDGHYIGSGGIHLTARDAAKFGLLYLEDGNYQGDQIISTDWIHASLRTYSEKAKDYGRSLTFRDLGYGYGWWTATVDDHEFAFAWGHGGQLIVILEELDMVIVTTADPFFGEHSGNSWKHEKATMNLVGDFIESLPSE